MLLYFVRHGESEANVLRMISNRDLKHGLTYKGRQQAAELADNLRGAGAGRIFTSPLLRAVQTAEILSSALDTDYEVTDALREFDCGIAEGRSDPEAWELHRQVMENWLQAGNPAARIDQGESYLDIQDRFVPFVQYLLEEAGSVDSILVGHGGLYLCMLPVVLLNVRAAATLPFPNAAYVLAEGRQQGLVCLEWCGRPMTGQVAGADGW
jgi:broad specificity phosphatase PhoE